MRLHFDKVSRTAVERRLLVFSSPQSAEKESATSCRCSSFFECIRASTSVGTCPNPAMDFVNNCKNRFLISSQVFKSHNYLKPRTHFDQFIPKTVGRESGRGFSIRPLSGYTTLRPRSSESQKKERKR